MKKIISAALFATFPCMHLSLFAQHNDWCGTDKKMEEIRQKYPERHIEWENLNQWIEENAEYIMSTSEGGQFIIPMVVHVIHNYGSENISDAQIVDAIRILNEDYNKQNADTANIVPAFKPIAGNAQFVFRLATKDPNGNCTNGITRTPSLLTYDADDDSKIISWPRAKYFNFWVVNNIYTDQSGTVTAGYATLPGFSVDGTDGIILDDNYVGSIGTSNGANFNKRVLTHEAGHFFNLLHPWGNGQIGTTCSGSDFVSDTPPTKGAFSTCPLTKDECGSLENVQNFMDYAICTNMFTNGQVTRMTTAINSTTGQRRSLWQPSNLTATGTNDPYTYPANCAPIADFKSNRYSVCVGGSITFTDQSYNATPTSWNWTFTDGTNTLNSTQQNPTITFNHPGIYNVTLTVSAPGGNGSVTKNNYVQVYDVNADFSSFLYEDSFDNSPLASGRWDSQYDWSSNVGWQETTLASYTAPNALRVNNYGSQKGISYSVVSPSYDFSAIEGTPTLTFKYAFARRTNDDLDQMRVYISSNCGQTWNVRWSKEGADLATVSNKTNNWAPSSSADWRSVTLTNLAAWANSNNVRFRFEFNSDGGNNIYLDDINIVGPNVGIESFTDASFSLVAYPNPTVNQITVSFEVPVITIAYFELMDMTGRVLKKSPLLSFIPGEANYVITLPEGISNGMYLLNAYMGESRYTKKILIQK
ncbi:MAG: M43 family zinc metalloprotease [Flavobacteriales bacterium]|nr:M43 family zinc metalloprotease [Flavobacteriales bacterium]